MSKVRVLLFSLVLSSVCAGLLGIARSLTAEDIARNEKLDEMRSILEAVDFRPAGGRGILEMSPAGVEQVFLARVALASGGDDLQGPFTFSDEAGQLAAHVIRIRGKGLWGDIFGFLAVSPEPRPDGKLLLRGITFYKEEETPGLGKRINEMKFRGQFRADKGTLAPGLRIHRGEGNEIGPHKVDGITSATVTGVGVEEMIEEGAQRYLSWRRQGGRQ